MYTFTEENIKEIVQKWTYKKVKDAKADRDALEEIVALVCTENDFNASANEINSWRSEKINL